MLDLIIYILITRIYIIIGVLFVAKFIMFLTSEYRSWSLSKFFYYPYMNLVLTSNPKRIRYKKLQNNLTLAILIFALMQAVFIIMFYLVIKVQ